MKTNREIRAEAWRLLWHEKWFGRMTAVGLTLGVIVGVVVGGIELAFRLGGVESLAAFQQSKLEAAASGLDFVSPSQTATVRMLSASLFQNFMQYLFSGIAMLGFASVALRAAHGERQGWFAAAMTGFRIPLGVFWLWFRVQIQTAFWLLATLMPSITLASLGVKLLGLPVIATSFVAAVPSALVLLWVIYRYRQVWFLKADDAAIGAGEAIRRSVEMMRGHKRRAVSLDCSYWPWLLALCAPAIALVAVGTASGPRLTPLYAVAMCVCLLALAFGVLFVGWYVSLGQAIFYRDLAAEEPQGVDAAAGS